MKILTADKISPALTIWGFDDGTITIQQRGRAAPIKLDGESRQHLLSALLTHDQELQSDGGRHV